MPSTDRSAGFTDVEKAAMKARAEELRSSGRGGARKAEEALACLDAIAAMPGDDRVLAERVHTCVHEVERACLHGIGVDDVVEAVRARVAAADVRLGTVDSWLLWNLTGGAAHRGCGTTRYSRAPVRR